MFELPGTLDAPTFHRYQLACSREDAAVGPFHIVVLASCNGEAVGTERVARLTREEIDERFEHLRGMTQFEGPGVRSA
jgi:hypothetical protein